MYVVGLLACLLVGRKGPNVFARSPPDAVETSSLNVTWYGKIDGMEPMHQVGDLRFEFFLSSSEPSSSHMFSDTVVEYFTVVSR